MSISDLGRTPISSTSPAGDDIRYDPLFEALQAEIDARPSAGSSGTDWKKVVEIAAVILESRSKDILVASYLAVGLLRSEGVPQGLLKGIIVLKDMIEVFWESMFPPLKRMRGREQAIGWWLERTEIYLGNITEVTPLQADTLAEISSAADAFYDLISDKCPETPSLRRLMEFIKCLPVETEEPPASAGEAAFSPPAEEPQSADASRRQPLPVQSGQQPTPKDDSVFSTMVVNNQDDANKLLSLVMEKNHLLLDFMFAEPTPDTSWYRLNLLSAWFEIRKLPTATGNKTLIPPPEPQILTSLISMKGTENWGGVIKSACYNIRRYPFWLDMNRFAAEALGMLGEKFREGRQAVESESVQFVRRFAGIENYTFSDGTSFADSQTQNWLRSLNGDGSAGGQVLSTHGDDFGSKVAEEFARCRELFNSGKQGEGLSIMQTHLQSSGSGRERYLWRLSLVQLLTLSGNVNLALPHISELMKDYDSYHLEEWDPDMALHALKSVWTVLSTQNDPESKRKADETLARISMLSLSDAFLLMK